MISRIEALSIPRESLLIGMESTACYHMNLFSFLLAEGYTAILINPLLISNFVKMQLRKTKTDKKDALVIAQYLLMHMDRLTQDILHYHENPFVNNKAKGKEGHGLTDFLQVSFDRGR